LSTKTLQPQLLSAAFYIFKLISVINSSASSIHQRHQFISVINSGAKVFYSLSIIILL